MRFESMAQAGIFSIIHHHDVLIFPGMLLMRVSKSRRLSALANDLHTFRSTGLDRPGSYTRASNSSVEVIAGSSALHHSSSRIRKPRDAAVSPCPSLPSASMPSSS